MGITYDVSVCSPVPQPPRGLPGLAGTGSASTVPADTVPADTGPAGIALANTAGVWRRSWIAVGHAGEIPDNTPVQVLLGGDAWVLTRMDGVLTAFDDHCPHRRSPLSAGSVTRAEDGSARLSCAFHGWRFDAEGQCDLMPEVDRGGHAHGGHHHHRWPARRAGHGRYADRGSRDLDTSLRAAHGVVERYGLVWLAAEEPLAPLPEFPEWGDGTAGRAACQSVTVHASARQVIDGLLDEVPHEVPDEVATGEWRVTGVWRAPGLDDGDPVAVRRAVKTAGPHASAHLRLELPQATIGILVSCQPEDWGTTRVYKLVTHSGLATGTAAMNKFTRDESRVLADGLSDLAGPASPALPLAGPVGGRAGQLSLAWRRLMARAAGLPPG